MKNKFPLLFLALLLVFIPWPHLASAFTLNLVAAQTLQTVLPEAHPLVQLASSFASASCRGSWFQGFIAQAQVDEPSRAAAWKAAIDCDPHYIVLLHKMLPDEVAFASYAAQVQHSSAESWFWLAEVRGGFANYVFHNLNDAKRDEVIALLRIGLALNPRDGLRWRELGDVLRRVDPQAAIDAYLQSCFNGDPGWNGCWRAGQTAEQLGEIENAIQYYRYSRWEGARDRADQLEAQLSPPK